MTSLALGTVQFGTAYGITNCSGLVPETQVREILNSAAASGVHVLDTAASYGDAERVLGRTLPAGNNFRIVTKTVPVQSSHIDQAALERVSAGLANSLELLARPKVEGLLVHHCNELLIPGGDKLFALLQAQQAMGRVGKIGVSVYDGDQLQALFPRYPIELVQLPLNVLDQRLLQSGWLQRLSDNGVEIHVRSAFLQGTLLADASSLPDRLGILKGGIARFQESCTSSRILRAAACLGFLKSLPEIDHVVCGVVSLSQFEEIVSAWNLNTGLDFQTYSQFALPDHPLLSPANWPPGP